MVTFVSNIESSDGRKEFDSYEQLDEFLSGFGSTRFNGQKVQFLVRENEYDSLRKLADLDEDIVVVTKPSNISILRNFIDQKHFNPSKYDLIISELNAENVKYENNNTIKFLMKILLTDKIHEQILDIAEKTNYYITNDFLLGNYYVDNSIHPINVLVAILRKRQYKGYLAKCRRTYTDKSIKKVMLDYLRKALEIINLELSGVQVKHNKISIFGSDKVSKLFYLLSKNNNLDEVLIEYGRKKEYRDI